MREARSATAPPATPIQQYFEFSLYLLLLVSTLALSATGKLDWLATFVPPVAIVIKALRRWRGYGPELSQGAATACLLGYLLFFPVDLWIFSRTLAAGAQVPALYAALLATVHLILFATLARLSSARTTRDDLFLTLLAFAMMLAAAVLTVDTGFLVFFFLLLVLCVSTFAGLELRRSGEGAVQPAMAPGTSAALRLQRALGTASVAVAVAALGVGAILFFVIPRFTAGMLSAYSLRPSLMSGFSDDVELGQIGEIKKSSEVVMRVRVDGEPYAAAALRWRGVALTTFDGRRWYDLRRDHTPITAGPDGWYPIGNAAPEVRRSVAPLHYTVLLEPLATNAVFVASQADRVRGAFAPELARGRWMRREPYLLSDATGSISNPFHEFARMRYEGLSYLPLISPDRLREASGVYPETIRRVYLQLPPLDPRIPELARRVTATAHTPYDRAAAIEYHLRTQYGYTLNLTAPASGDPLAYFLFERRAGHCEYFATAMTVMLRTLGVPAREVNGFLPGEYNSVGEDFIVRSSDAHSWVEVYFPGYGWIPFDPTPSAAESSRGWLGQLGLYWDWFQLQWSEWVINYDFRHQETLARGLQRGIRDWTRNARNYLADAQHRAVENVRNWANHSGSLFYGLFAGLALAALLALFGGSLWKTLGPLWPFRFLAAGESTAQAATYEYRQMLSLLERRGLAKRPGQTPLEFVASLPAGELTIPLAEFTELYQRARFGSCPHERLRMSELLERIRQVLRPR